MKLNVLSIDPAEKLGWASFLGKESGQSEVGLLNLKLKRGESFGMKLIRLRAWLFEMHESLKLNVIYYEGVSGKHSAAVQSHAKLVGVVEVFCIDNGIEYREVKATEIKKFATGSGRANKEAMVLAAKEKYGYDGEDDNEADALHILGFSKNELNL